MKLLFLMRHAKSSWADPGMDDYDRPLNPRGREAAPEMGRRMAGSNFEIQQIIASSAVRARETTMLFAEAIAFDAEQILFRDDLYLSSPSTQIGIAQSADDHCETLLMVAHNPGISECIGMLSGQEVGDLPTAALAVIRFEANDWKDLQFGKGELLYLDTPKQRLV